MPLEQGGNEPFPGIVVKNTFIDVVDSSGNQSRRSASAPPSLWGPPRTGRDHRGKVGRFSEQVQDSGVAKLAYDHKRSHSTNSTEAAISDTTSVCEALSPSDSCCTALSQSTGSRARRVPASDLANANIASLRFRTERAPASFDANGIWMPHLVAIHSAAAADPSALLPSAVATADTTSTTQLPIQVLPCVAAAGRRLPQEFPLEPYTLGMDMATFNRHVLSVGAEVEAAMRLESDAIDIEIHRHPEGLILQATLPHHDADQRCQVLKVAMQAALKVVQRSKIVHALGDRLDPFKRTLDGFTIDVGSIEDDGSVCLEMYASGFCPRGAMCTWRHPSLRRQLAVTLTHGQAAAFDGKSIHPISGHSTTCDELFLTCDFR